MLTTLTAHGQLRIRGRVSVNYVLTVRRSRVRSVSVLFWVTGGFLYSSKRQGRLWSPPTLLSGGYGRRFPWGKSGCGWNSFLTSIHYRGQGCVERHFLSRVSL